MSIKNNTTSLQELLEVVNNLPDTGGVKLPELANEGSAAELFSGKELIDSEGNVVTGTFSIDNELTEQDDLITQIQNAVDNLPDAGGSEPVLQSKTVTPSTSEQTIVADDGYDGLDTVTVNAMATATQATPSITVSSSGLITASATQTAGYVAAGTKSVTKQLTTQVAQTITPSTSDKTIASGRYLTGTQTIKGDSNLVAGNIKSGVSIFGVTGSYEGSGSSSGSTESNNTITILNSTNADLTIGGYKLTHSESIKIPYNLVMQNQIIFITTLSTGTIISATNALMPTRIFNASIPIGETGSNTIPVKIGCIIIGSITAGSTVEIYVQ